MSAARSRRPRPRRRLRSRLFLVAAVAVAFVAGLGLGRALRDGPARGSQTLVRTLRPLPLDPLAARTVTVTTTAP